MAFSIVCLREISPIGGKSPRLEGLVEWTSFSLE